MKNNLITSDSEIDNKMAPFGCICPQIGRVRDRTDPIDDVVHKQLPSMLAKSKESRVVVEARFRLVRLGNLANLYNIEWVYWKTIYNERAVSIFHLLCAG